MAGVCIWAAGYALELSGADLPTKIFWAKVEYIGIVSVPVAWLAFALQYTGRERWLTGRNLALLSAIPFVTLLLAWTNEAHELVWSSTTLDRDEPFPGPFPAVADRPRAREVLISGALRADYLETSGPLADSAAALLPHQPMLLHNSVWDWSLGHPAALKQREVLPRTLHALRLTRAPWFSVHLGFSATEVGIDEGRMRARTAPLGREELFENIVRNVRGLARAIPVPLFLENLDYNPGGAYEHVCEPEFIAAVLEEVGEVDLLLDLAHARVSASRLGFSTTDYLGRLPMERVRQLHVSGVRLVDGVMVDAHEPLLEEDYSLLRDLLDVTTPLALTLEYDRNESALKEQLGELRDILKHQR